MADTRNIYLVGPRASGKTSVGRELARRLGRRFMDTDHELVAMVGAEIAEYVTRCGWNSFRDREAEVLEHVAAMSNLVVGCGGGLVLRPENRQLLSGGIVLYLAVGPDELARRLSRNPNEAQRPSLTGKSLADEAAEVLVERDSLYRECAHAVLGQASLRATVNAALEFLEHRA